MMRNSEVLMADEDKDKGKTNMVMKVMGWMMIKIPWR